MHFKDIFILFKSRLFLKLFFSFILVSFFASFIAFKGSSWVFSQYSYDYIENKIEDLLEKEQELYMYLYFDDVGKAETLLTVHRVLDYFYVYDKNGQELLNRPLRPYLASSFPPQLSRLVMEYELNRPLYVESIYGTEYRIEVNPDIFKPLAIQNTVSKILLFMLASALICALLARMMSRRVLAIKTVTDKAMAGNYAVTDKPKRYSKDEIGELAKGLDQMMLTLHNNIEAKNKVLANISHELRSPLARLMIAAELLKTDRHKSDKYFAKIEKEINHMDKLIDNIIKAQQHNFNQQQMVFTAVDLHELFTQLIDDIKFEFDDRVDIYTELPLNSKIQGDKDKLNGLFHNLLRNAVIHNPPTVKVTIKSYQQHGNVVITVSDNGKGVDEASLARIFEPFNKSNDSQNGSGLGLAIAKNIVAQHHGKITANNNYTADHKINGFAISVTLPQIQVDKSD